MINITGFLAAEEAKMIDLTVSEARIVVAQKFEDGDYTLDLPQAGQGERTLTVWRADNRNKTQEFALIPADDDAWFICALESGNVLGVKAAEPNGMPKVVGIRQKVADLKESASIDNNAGIKWIIERDEETDAFRIKAKSVSKYLVMEKSPPDRGTPVLLDSQKSAAALFRLDIIAPSKSYRVNQATARLSDPPRPTKYETVDYPSATEEVCVSEKLVPYFFVEDSRMHKSWDQRVKNQPVYRLREFQSWVRVLCEEWHGYAEKEMKVEKLEEKTTLSWQLRRLEESRLSSVSNLPFKVELSARASLTRLPLPTHYGIHIGGSYDRVEQSTNSSTTTGGADMKKTATSEAVTVKFGKTATKVLYANWLLQRRVVLETCNEKGESEVAHETKAFDYLTGNTYTYPENAPKN